MTATRRTPGLWRLVLATLGFTVLMTVCARIAIPFYPVAITLQTWAVLVSGAILGPRWGTASVALYLALAAAGLPVLANGGGGLAAVTGASAGYLIGFPAAAFLTGWAAEQGRLDRPLSGFVILLLAHALTLVTGVAWLIISVGLDPSRAVTVGALPYLIGAVVKSGLVLVTLWAWRRAVRRA